MAKRASGKKTATPKKAPTKRASTTKRSRKDNADPSALSDRHRDEVLKKLRKLRARPTHATKHLGPVIPLDMGPPEKPNKRTAKKKSVKKKAAKRGRKAR